MGGGNRPRTTDKRPLVFGVKKMNKNHTVLLIAGTRPEVIKLAPVYFALREVMRDVCHVFEVFEMGAL